MCYYPNVNAVRSPRWGATTKLVVALVMIVVAGIVVRRFADLLTPVVVAVMFAYVLNPPVTFIAERLRISRGLAVGIIYLGLVLLLAGGSTALGFAIRRQVIQLDENFNLQRVLTDLPQQLDKVLHGRTVAGPFTVIFNKDGAAGPVTTPFVVDLSAYDLTPLYRQALSALQPVFSQTGRLVGNFASAAASTAGWALFVLVIGFYMLLDAPRLGQAVHGMAFPGYEADVRRLMQELNLIWSAFLRGQLILALVIGGVTTVVMTVLGLRNSLVVGLIAGALEFIPIVGPFIAGAIGVAVALFQPSNPYGLSTLWYIIVVLIAFLLIQQIENNVLVPRIIGQSLDLHPLAVLIAAVMGASLAGILGLLLAAPVLATLRLLGGYAYRKFFDLDRWPEPLGARAKRRAPFRWPFGQKRPPASAPTAPAPDSPRSEYSYRVFWTKMAREWDGTRRRAIASAVAAVVARPEFEPNAYERRYTVAGLDDEAHAGESLIALQKVLSALDPEA